MTQKLEIKSQINSLPPISETLKAYGIETKKNLGQNFIFDLNITSKIVRLAGDIKNQTIIEIGCGAGSLTRPIIAADVEKLIIIEKDTTVLPAIEPIKNIAPNVIEILNIDALKVDYSKILQGKKCKIIANLPYNVATELLFNWLHNIENFNGFTLMFQKEVAERITAKPKTKDYGWLAIFTQVLCHAEIDFILPPSAFFPPPKVDSAVVSIIPRKAKLYDTDLKKLETICKTAFVHRRKTIRNNLKNLFKNIDSILEEVGIPPQTRPEDIDIATYCKLTKLM